MPNFNDLITLGEVNSIITSALSSRPVGAYGFFPPVFFHGQIPQWNDDLRAFDHVSVDSLEVAVVPLNYTPTGSSIAGQFEGIDSALGRALSGSIGAGFDGGGDDITAGVAVRVPVRESGNITRARLVADQSGSIEIQVKLYAASDTTFSSPTLLTTITLSSDISVTGALDFDIEVGDHIEFVTSGTITVERVTCVLEIEA